VQRDLPTFIEKKMNIAITQYEREDGVLLFRCHNPKNKWMLRSILGPAWFWDPTENKWIINPSSSTNTWEDTHSRFLVTEEEGLKLLKVIPKKV
jgi:hypothetical protein